MLAMTEMAIGVEDTVFVFETAMRVRNTEVGIGQQLTIEALVALLTEVRVRFLHAKGVTEVDANYHGLMITDVATRIYSRARVREGLLFEIGVKNLTDLDGEFIFKVTRLSDGSQVASAHMGFVGYDYRSSLEVPFSTTLYDALALQPLAL